HLHIRHFAIIDALELELDQGFSVLSGETGAGKSILLDALGLIMGDRADTGMIRAGQDKADITAEFSVVQNSPLDSWLFENDLEAAEDDNNVCLIRRVINRNGRSRAFINGQQAPLQKLKELGELLLDIHGQHSHHSLLKTPKQLALLDEYAKCGQELDDTKKHFLEWQACQQELEKLQQDNMLRQNRLDFLQFQLKELDALALVDGEVESLEKEILQLSSGSKHLEALTELDQLLNAEHAINDQLARASGVLQELARKNNLFKDLAETLESADIMSREVAADIAQKLENVDADPQREAWLNDRLGAIQGLARKHRVSATGLFEFSQKIRIEHDSLLNADDRIVELKNSLSSLETGYRECARRLSDKRDKAAKVLQKTVSDSVQNLGMPNAQFEIKIQFDNNSDPKLLGLDVIEFLFSANPGQALEPIRKVASGGELSRIGLALAVSSQSKKSAPVVVFDEVDAGIGGVTANTVGEYLQTLATDYQVLCVTHLAQVAAKADHQFRVMKMTDGKTTHTQVRHLNKDERVTEIVRMLGSQDSDKALTEHAQKLLEN
ncbi:MAG: DNA repair protein RecN, partial [Gammaproteobacteria bacterium]|nr:DNA repair protein RecN [Gammaproteobacteria bacterium]